MALHLGLHLFLLSLGLACLATAAPTAFIFEQPPPTTHLRRPRPPPRPRPRRETVKVWAALFTSGALHLFNNKSEVLILRKGEKPKKDTPHKLFQLPEGYKLNAALAVPTFFTKDLYFFGDGDTFYRRNNRVLTNKLYKNRLPRFLQCGIDATVKDEKYVYYFRGCSYLQQVNNGEWIEEPQPMGELGLPCNVDAAWNDGANTHVLKGDQVWTLGGDVNDHESFDDFYYQNLWRLDKTPVALFNESERFPSTITRRGKEGNPMTAEANTKLNRKKDECRLPRRKNRKARGESAEEGDVEDERRGGRRRGSRQRFPSVQLKMEGEAAKRQMLTVDLELPVGGDMKKVRNSKSESYDGNETVKVEQVEQPYDGNAGHVRDEIVVREDSEVNRTALADPLVAPVFMEAEVPLMREKASEVVETGQSVNTPGTVDKENGGPGNKEEQDSLSAHIIFDAELPITRDEASEVVETGQSVNTYGTVDKEVGVPGNKEEQDSLSASAYIIFDAELPIRRAEASGVVETGQSVNTYGTVDKEEVPGNKEEQDSLSGHVIFDAEMPITRAEASGVVDTGQSVNTYWTFDKEGVPTHNDEHNSENHQGIQIDESETNTPFVKTEEVDDRGLEQPIKLREGVEIGVTIPGVEATTGEQVVGEPVPGIVYPGNTAQDNIPPGNTAQDIIPPGNTAQDNIPLGNMAQHNIPLGNTAQDNIPPGNMAQDNIPPGSTAQDNIHPGSTAQDNIPPGSTTQDNIPLGNTAPGGTARSEIVLVETTLDETAPGETVAVETTLDERVQGDTHRDDTVPGETTLDETFPGETVVVETTPHETVVVETSLDGIIIGETAPGETTLDETVPGETTLDETVPGETTLDETVPGEAVVFETFPSETAVETTPDETFRGETAVETTPDETFPGETVVEMTPDETVPGETFVVETTPDETVPGDTVPVGTVKAGTLVGEEKHSITGEV